jgi:glycosyltransferase involved in cell wall biosynthesis
MNILFFTDEWEMCGIDTFILALSAGLQARGHHCELFLRRHGPLQHYVPADLRVHVGGDLVDLMRVVRQGRFDVVHARSSDRPTGIAVVRALGARLVVTAHGVNVSAGWTTANCDAFSACSRGLRDDLQPLNDIPIQAVLHGIDTDRFRPGNHPVTNAAPIVAWVGRAADPRKNIDRFAAIAPYLKRAGLRLWVVDPNGPDAVERVLPDAARTLRPLTDFWGGVAVERMPATYQEIAASGGCVVSTSPREGLGLAVLEAQACGCPAIGPDVRGINESVDPAHGGVLYPFDMQSDQLADLIVRTLSDRDGTRRRGQQSASHVREHFSLDRMVQQYLQIYQAPPASGVLQGTARGLLSPFRSWDDYVKDQWAVGHRQYEAAQRLANQGDWRLARIAARTSLMTSPTLYARPKRFAFLMKTQMVGAWHDDAGLHGAAEGDFSS